jgi:hypothetical protein
MSNLGYTVEELTILHHQALEKFEDTGEYAWEIAAALLEGLIEGAFDTLTIEDFG